MPGSSFGRITPAGCEAVVHGNRLERFQPDWKRSRPPFASNFITLSGFAIPVRVILL
jgi:hypothetical protein